MTGKPSWRTRVPRFLAWLGGADFFVLARCPTERSRFTALGGAVLMTGGLAMVAGAFAMRSWLHTSTGVAVVFGLLWGIGIMNLDRWLLLATRRQSQWYWTALLASPRVLLAIVVGFVVSQPLVLQVFANEIAVQAASDKNRQENEQQSKINHYFATIQTLQKELGEVEAKLSGQDTTKAIYGNPELERQQEILISLRSAYRGAAHAANCEADGTCGSRHVGEGPLFHRKEQYAERLGAEVRSQEVLVKGIESRLSQSAERERHESEPRLKSSAAALTQKISTERQEEIKETAQYRHLEAAPIGLLDRENALDELTAHNGALSRTKWLLTIFILVLDSVPILFKTLTLLARPSLYEETQKAVEEATLQNAKIAEERRSFAHQIDIDTIVDEAHVRKRLQTEAMEDLTMQVVAVQKESAEAYIRAWRTRVADETKEQTEAHLAPSPSRKSSRFSRGGTAQNDENVWDGLASDGTNPQGGQ